MLTDDDIVRLTTAFSNVFATKDDLKRFATKDDLVKVEKKINTIDEKVDRNGKMIQDLDERVDTLGKEVVDYTKDHYSAHQKLLDDHDSRIQTLEQFHA